MARPLPSFLLVSAMLCLCCTASVAATQGSEQRADQAVPAATDRVLTMPVASLTPEQITQMQQKLLDWPQLARYRDENATLPPPGPGRVVFFGDSITDAWDGTGIRHSSLASRM